MYRSRRIGRIGLLTVILAATLVATASGQVTVEVQQITTPVLDIKTETSSIDQSVKRSESSTAVEVTLEADVLFEFGKASLTEKARSRLRKAAADVRASEAESAKITGHTDSKGGTSYNLGLSKRRAVSVRDALEKLLGGDAPDFTVDGRGESDPAAANTKPNGKDNPKGRALNRRVEIRLKK